MRRPLLFVAGLVIAVMLIVLFVPGLRDSIERYFLSWLGRLAR